MYNDGLEEPDDVTTDLSGNVYVTDDTLSKVNEYAQGVNKAIASCTIGGVIVESVAVDALGDVFVAANGVQRSGNAHIYEFHGGLSGCHAHQVIVTNGGFYGMAFDNRNRLVLCDGSGIDIIKPPYSRISGTLGSGYSEPISVRIKKDNRQAYIADIAAGKIFIVSYPGGKALATLGSQQGLTQDVSGAVDSENFIP
jgi:sugar lactone lactonase YvrE